MKALFSLFAALLCPLLLAAQDIRIAGRVTDTVGEAIAFANVALMRADSTLQTGQSTDRKGKFSLRAPKADEYLLQVSFVGYMTQTLRLTGINRDTETGDIVLPEDAVLLEGVTVTASSTSMRTDRQIVLPSPRAVAASTSGYDLLGHLQLEGLKVDPVQQAVNTVSGGSVQLRINDVKASTSQVLALKPDEVVRVEYIDRLGMRYAADGVEVVINFVVKQPTAGVTGSVSGGNAVSTGFGNDNFYVQANHKLSTFGLNYFVTYRNYDDRFVDETQTFALADGSVRQRISEGLNTPFNYATHSLAATYNLTKADNYMFNAIFTQKIDHYPHNDQGQLIREEGRPDLYSFTRSSRQGNNPSLDLYFKKNFAKQQQLMLNVVGTYIGTDYSRYYNEAEEENGTPLSEYNYDTDGKRYSLIGEGYYSKDFEKVTLGAGLRYLHGYTRNRYRGSVNETADMRNSSLYGYVEVQGKWGKLGYGLGAGVSREYFDESGQGYTFYTFRPMVQLSYPLFKGATLRYNFSSSPNLPSLSSLSDIPQQLTDLEMQRGNRDLNPYRSYSNRLQFSWSHQRVGVYLTGSHSYSKNPIMEQTERTEMNGLPMFVYAVANQKSFSRVGGQLSINAQLIPDILSLSLYGGVNRYDSRGHTYSHHYTAWNGGGSLSASYKGVSFYAGMNSRYNSLYGESIDYGETNCVLQLMYTWRQLSAGLGMLYPFQPDGWSAGSRLKNRWVQKESWTHIRDNGNMVLLQLTWRFSTGRKHQAGRKQLSNRDSDTGIAM